METHLKIGLYGGSFDPIHNGHLVLIKTSLEKLGLDKIIIMPSGGAAHYKSEPALSAPNHRVEMIRRAIDEIPKLEVSTYEIDQGRFCYTINTLRYLREKYPSNTKIYLLVGGDWIDRIPEWHEGEAILREFHVAVFSRPGYEYKLRQQENSSTNIHYIQMPLVDISSSDIRERAKQGKDIGEYVPQPVAEYIDRNKLYKK